MRPPYEICRHISIIRINKLEKDSFLSYTVFRGKQARRINIWGQFAKRMKMLTLEKQMINDKHYYFKLIGLIIIKDGNDTHNDLNESNDYVYVYYYNNTVSSGYTTTHTTVYDSIQTYVWRHTVVILESSNTTKHDRLQPS